MTPEELGGFYSRKKVHLQAFANRCIGDKATAEDLVQETFVKLLRHCHKIDRAAPNGYVWTVLRQVIVNEARRRNRRRETLMGEKLEEFEGDSSGDVAFDQQSAEEAFRIVLRQAVANLTPKRLRALEAWLKAVGHMAQALDIFGEDETPGVYAGQIHHAKERLRQVRREHQDLYDQLSAPTLWKMLNEIVCEARSQPARGMS
jgi:RNA polymerase sigma-70 factor (ECF subfamily)